MYWWNASKLAEDLREGRVDEKERFKYFLATFVVWSLIVHGLFFFSSVTFSIETLLFPAVNLTTIVLGVILCYRVNRSGDNYNFIGRMVCLGWPIGIWFGMFFMIFFLISAYLADWNWFSGIMWWFGLFYISSYYRAIAGQLAFSANAVRVASVLQAKGTEWTSWKVFFGVVGGIGIFVMVVITIVPGPTVSRFLGEGRGKVFDLLALSRRMAAAGGPGLVEAVAGFTETRLMGQWCIIRANNFSGAIMEGIQFVTDDKGEKVAVQIDLRKYGDLWEDVYDSLTARKRAKEPRESLASVKERLIKQKKLNG
jgi:hypothetical protein